MSAARDLLARFFRCSDRERAVFEAGVKLGSVYHQYVGCPVDRRGVAALERAIEAGGGAPPAVPPPRGGMRRGGAARRGERRRGADPPRAVKTPPARDAPGGGRAPAPPRLRFEPSLRYPAMRVE